MGRDIKIVLSTNHKSVHIKFVFFFFPIDQSLADIMRAFEAYPGSSKRDLRYELPNLKVP